MYDLVGFEPGWTVIDPCCGEGVFLAEARRRGARLVVGLERDPVALAGCRAALGLRPARKSATHDGSMAAVIEQDGLAEITARGIPQDGYDLVIGNPPFNSGRTRDPQADAACRRYAGALPSLARGQLFPGTEWSAAEGRGDWEIEAGFLMRFIALARAGGRVAVLMPKGFFANRKLRSLRAALLSDWSVDGVVELPAGAFAGSGTAVRTAVLLLRKEPPKPQACTILAKVAGAEDQARALEAFRGYIPSPYLTIDS